MIPGKSALMDDAERPHLNFWDDTDTKGPDIDILPSILNLSHIFTAHLSHHAVLDVSSPRMALLCCSCYSRFALNHMVYADNCGIWCKVGASETVSQKDVAPFDLSCGCVNRCSLKCIPVYCMYKYCEIRQKI